MPVFFQKEIDVNTRLGIWHIREEESFFKKLVPIHREVTHAHKRLQHLAGRFLLKYLFPDFPSHLIQIADTKKPFLKNEIYHFSISHCGDYAAAIVSATNRVGIDIEIPVEKIARIRHKFLSDEEQETINPLSVVELTQIWSAKEAVFKWYGLGKVDFKDHIQLKTFNDQTEKFRCFFSKNKMEFDVCLSNFDNLCLTYLFTKPNW